MNQDRLEQLMVEVARELDYPPTPPLAAMVRRKMESDTPVRVPPPRAWLGPAVVVAAVVAALGFTLAFSPVARRAAADLLGVIGIHISIGGNSDTEGLPGPELSGTDLGERVSAAQAEAIVGFDVRGTSALMGPSRTYVDRSIGDTGMVSTVFYPPQSPDQVVYLITEFRASVDGGFFKKVSQTGGEVQFVQVGGATGYWVSGEPHQFYYVDSAGNFREESIRLAGNVLLWEQGGITYRIEGASSLEKALDIAGSLR